MLKDFFADCDDLRRAGRHEHDVDEPLGDDLADLISEIGERAIAPVTGFARRRNAKGHVGIFGVSEDEGAVR
jgi:hypothetical protein